MTTLDDDVAIFAQQMKKLTNYIGLPSVLFVTSFGLIFNTISIILFARKALWDTTIGLYNVIIMVNCNLVIIINIFIQLTPTLGNDAILWSDFSCIILFYSSRLTTTFSSWLSVLVTLDRFFRITLWYRVASIKKKKSQFSLIILMFILLTILLLPNIFYKVVSTSSFSSIANQTTITKTCQSTPEIETYIDMIKVFVRALIPFMLIIIINSYLIYKLIQIKSKIEKYKISNNEHNYTYSIVALTTFYVISILPLVVSIIMLQIMQRSNMTNTKSYVIAIFCYNLGLLIS